VIPVGVASERPQTGPQVERIARELVYSNKARLFPDEDEVQIIDVELGPPQNHRWGSHHRGLTVRYRRDGRPAALDLWLKFQPGLDTLFPLLEDYERRLDRPVFPHPYFAWRAPDGEPGFLATGRVEGMLLRDRLLRLAPVRQSARLAPVFRSNGAKMRAFHDAFAAEEAVAVAGAVQHLADLVERTPQLLAAERETVAAHLARAADRLGVTVLPAIRTHDDWVLRNIIVAPDGTDYVIDAGGLQRPPKWRWYDIGLFLLNLDFQLKWAPLTTRAMMTRLWRAFWQGYVGERGLPDGLAPPQAEAVLYLVRLYWLLDGVVRQPYIGLVTGSGALNQLLRRRLKSAIASGRCAVLDF
jgi:hypothetical protein